MAYSKKNDPTRAGVPIELDRPRVVLYNAFAFIEYDAALGRDLAMDAQNVQRVISPIAGNPEAAEKAVAAGVRVPIGTIRDLLWAGLLEDDPELTRSDVACMFNARELPSILQAIFTALRKSLPEPKARPTIAETTTIETNGVPSPPSYVINSERVSDSDSPQLNTSNEPLES